MRTFLALLMLVPTVCPVRSRVVVTRQSAVSVPAVITPAVVATTFVPVTVPAYSVSYAPGSSEADLAALREEIRSLRELVVGQGGPVRKGEERVPAPKEQVSAQQQAINLVQTKCAQCHSGANAKKGFQIFTADNKLQVSSKLLGAVYRGSTPDGKTMPPTGRGFSDEEVSLILDNLGR